MPIDQFMKMPGSPDRPYAVDILIPVWLNGPASENALK